MLYVGLFAAADLKLKFVTLILKENRPFAA
jgi:hypothetical protein